MSRSRKRTWFVAALTWSVVLCFALSVGARPGGGHSYSGHSSSHSHSSSGSGSGGGDGGDAAGLVLQLVLLCVEYPAFGVPVLILIVMFLIGKAVLGARNRDWSTSTPAQVDEVRSVNTERDAGISRVALDAIRGIDPGFSLVLFEDFAYMLYGAVQRARALGTEPLSAYLAPELAQSLVDAELADVQGIVIGAMRYVRFSGVQGPMLEIELELEANYVEQSRNGNSRRYYAADRLLLTRSISARSRPKARAHTLDCPNCGAPLEAVRGTKCNYCQQNVGFGRFDWMIKSLSNLSREERGPLLTSDVPEAGTELPTLCDPGASARFEELQRRDPAVTWPSVQGRVAQIFGELQAAWSARDALRIRPYVTDNSFQSMYYWIDLYTQAKCRNVSENARILRMDLANVMSDPYFDSLTLRLFATGLDYTISDDGKVLSGSRTRPRTYSEYWTLLRASARRGEVRRDDNCPNCGAPLRIGMTGQCEYCRVKVTSGDFDWVLSRIEQDDSYNG